MVKKLIRRMNVAVVYARGFGLGVVFAFLDPLWTLKKAQKAIRKVPHDAAGNRSL